MSASERLRRGGVAAAAAALFAALAASAAARADEPAAVPAAAEPAAATDTAAHPLTADDVGAWLDGFMPEALKQGGLAGAVVSIVKDGHVLVERGYGYADIGKGIPMDPVRTLVRPGSISKLFMWTAVMQLVEQGKIDLDADVNQYLDFRIPPYDGKPITMRNLMTHTAGFEENLKYLIGEEGDAMPAFDVLLKENIPARIFAPGTTPAYSNYGASLAGYIVQRVSGLSFYDYIEQKILEPLGMTSTTFRQPLPAGWESRMARGYENASGEPHKFELVGPAPAGSATTTADDMTHFMIAHLQDGRYGDAQILQPATAKEMHDTALTIVPHVNRMLLGFYEADDQGRHVISHGGDTEWFHSDLYLFMDHGVGLFVSFNSLGVNGAAHTVRMNLKNEFADRYLPMPPLPPPAVDAATAKQHAAMIAGHYDNSRRVETTFMSLLNLVSQAQVTDNGDGTISFSLLRSASGKPYRWQEVEPFVWRQERDTARLAAVVKDGRVTRFTGSMFSPFMVFDRPPASRNSAWLLPAIIGALAVLLLTTLAWPVSALVRRHYRAPARLKAGDASALRWTRIVSTATVLVWAGWIGLMVAMFSNMELLSPKTDPELRLLQVAGMIVFVGGTLVGLWSVARTLGGGRRWLAKGWAALVGLSLLVSLWVAFAYHLLSYGVRY